MFRISSFATCSLPALVTLVSSNNTNWYFLYLNKVYYSLSQSLILIKICHQGLLFYSAVYHFSNKNIQNNIITLSNYLLFIKFVYYEPHKFFSIHVISITSRHNEISYYQYGHGSVGRHEIEFMNLNEKICCYLIGIWLISIFMTNN